MMKYSYLLASLALFVVTVSANITCCYECHQPKLPEGAKKLRKF